MEVSENQPILDEENSHKIKSKKFVESVSTGERKSLQTLQLAPDGTLTGIEPRPGKLIKAKHLSVYTDPVRTWKEIGTQTDGVDHTEGSTQTVGVDGTEGSTQTDEKGPAPMVQILDDSGAVVDIDQEAYDLMVKEPPPERYWELVAEERRRALAETLVENKFLHDSMNEMKEENEKLLELAEHAECLVNIITKDKAITAALNESLGEDLAQELLAAVSSPNLGTVPAASSEDTGPMVSTPTRGNAPSSTEPKPIWPIFSPVRQITTSSPCEGKTSDKVSETVNKEEEQPDEETKKGLKEEANKGLDRETNLDSDELKSTENCCDQSEKL